MAGHDIIVLGASAGGVEALTHIVRDLPRDLPAALFVVLHVSPSRASMLPQILSRNGALPAAHAHDMQPIERGRVYIAPPDRHLLVERGYVRITREPTENGVRPAADSLFRTAALAYGPRVVGIVLTGTLNDGTAGLAAIKQRGGVAVAQDPVDAVYPGMPLSAVEQVHVDHVVRLADIPGLIVQLTRTAPAPVPQEDRMSQNAKMEADIVELNERQPAAAIPQVLLTGKPSDLQGDTPPDEPAAVGNRGALGDRSTQ